MNSGGVDAGREPAVTREMKQLAEQVVGILARSNSLEERLGLVLRQEPPATATRDIEQMREMPPHAPLSVDLEAVGHELRKADGVLSRILDRLEV